jgi:hypothetical protein
MIGGLLKSASKVALFAAAGLFVGGVAMPSAKAADLGGDCCADLEERVAELEATTARKGNRRVSLTVSGQVNTAIMAWDDGVSNAVFIVDNAVSRSGFNFDGTARINPNLTAGFQMVLGMATGARSHQTTQIDDDGGVTGDSTIAIELANWFLRHDTLGELRLGRINTASSGTTIVDLGGAGVIANAQAQLWAGNFFIPGAATATVRWSSLMGGTTLGISGLSRANAISYTTPTVAGFSAQVAWGEQDAVDDGSWDIAARYAGEWAGFRVAAAASYGRNVGGTTDAEDAASTTTIPSFGDGADIRKWQGSASVLHVPSGLYLSGSYARQSYHGITAGETNFNFGGNRPDATMWYLQGGVSQNWTGLGKTVVYGEYGRFEDGAAGALGQQFGAFDNFFTVTSSEVEFWGIGVVQHIDAAAMELFLSYRNYSADVTAVDSLVQLPNFNSNYEDLRIIMSGARIRF